jgi:tryptophan halogenase
MINEVKRILIVGGGTAGLVSALMLKKHLNCVVDLVYSKSIGIIGVGEGSTEHFRHFMEFVGITHHDIIKNCDATYKSGILFEGWGEKTFLHNIGGSFTTTNSQYPFVYARQISKNDPYLTSKILWENKIDKEYLGRAFDPPFNQFHFNTFKLNEFLSKKAIDMGINLIDDEISGIDIDSVSGNIKSIQSEKGRYEYDFYIDSTGFRRILINSLGASWQSFGKYLKMKSAITFQTGDEENYNLWTKASAFDYGWVFKIPVWGRYGNGYIFDSDYITKEQAAEELEKRFFKKIEIGKSFSFDPGYLKTPWMKNCCAVGISSSFVEPLEATSIGVTIQQIFLLMNKILNYNQKVTDSYNKSFEQILENVRDFIVLHYLGKNSSKSKFWQDIAVLDIPDSLKGNLEIWQNKMPIREDFCNLSGYILFLENNFISVMEGLNLFNSNMIKKEYDRYPQTMRDDADNIILTLKSLDNKVVTIDHKHFLNLIRESV